MRSLTILCILLLANVLSGCSGVSDSGLATPLPVELLPTVIAQTLQAEGVELATPGSPPTSESVTPTVTASTAAPSATNSSVAEPTQTQAPIPSSTVTLPSPILTTTLSSATQNVLVPTSPPPVPPPASPPPDIPEARIQIYRLGELSFVTSPVEVTARLTSKVGKVARIELFGEDGRLLARQVRVYNSIPWHVAMIGEDLEFEISGVAEQGRLVISVEDQFGRLIDVNSVNLILLSTGPVELNPISTLWQAIVIQEPAPLTLVQGGSLIVSGLAQISSNDPLRVALIAQDGRVIGQRLAGVETSSSGGHVPFIAEVPYSVTELTPVLLVVYEDGGVISAITHLSSTDILLSP